MIKYFEIDRKATEELILNPIKVRQREYHEIMWVQKGHAIFIIDGDTFEVKANAFFILPKDRYQQFLPKELINGQVIRFTEDFLNHFPRLLFSKFNQLAEVIIDFKVNSLFQNLFEAFQIEYDSNTTNHKVLANILQSILFKLEEIKRQELSISIDNTSIDLIDRLQILFDEYIKEHRSVQFYANLLNVTPRKLGTIIKSTLNCTTENLISRRLIIEIKRELHNSKTITEIAYDLNFQDTSYFTKFFKRLTKSTPKQFRNNNLSAK